MRRRPLYWALALAVGAVFSVALCGSLDIDSRVAEVIIAVTFAYAWGMLFPHALQVVYSAVRSSDH